MDELLELVREKFLRYVSIDTASDEESNTFPSTEKQKDLGRLLAKELNELGASDVNFDEKYGYVYATVPATGGQGTVLALLSHMDTSPEASGKDVKARIIREYDGRDILLNAQQDIWLKTQIYPEILAYKGQELIVTDGTTLLGADDKAGVAEIMTLVEILLRCPEIPHPELRIVFTPDEEVGAGVDHIDMEKVNADYAYTVDGGGIGELEYENFNAASAEVTFHGVVVHPGEAKGKMKNASLLAMEFNAKLPEKERPESTEGYEGFFHLMQMNGEIETAVLKYIVRDHDRDRFEERKNLMESVAREMNETYGMGSVELRLADSYYNMKEHIIPQYAFLIDNAKKAMELVGVEPKIQPIRGGTDGARLSFMGLPCPNICTGGHNFHGRFEYICVDSMKKIVRILLEILKMTK